MFFHKLPCGSFTEACALNRDLKRFFDETGTEYPVWKQLEQDAGKYLIPKDRSSRFPFRTASVSVSPA